MTRPFDVFRSRASELRTENLDFTLLWSPWGTIKLFTYFLWVVVVVVVVRRQGLTV